MFGTDLFENVPSFLTAYRESELSEEQLAWSLGKTAAKVFNL
jgi:hypothetical protein